MDTIDIRTPEVGVQVEVSADGKTLWVNVDGICRLRIQDIPLLEVNDSRISGWSQPVDQGGSI